MTEFGPLSDHYSKINASDYKLFGISHHSGSLDDGHYFVEVMDIDSESWFKCEDSKINKISCPENISASACVLFYIRSNESENL